MGVSPCTAAKASDLSTPLTRLRTGQDPQREVTHATVGWLPLRCRIAPCGRLTSERCRTATRGRRRSARTPKSSRGGEEQLLLVEHPPVITFGRRPGVARNVIASDESLKQLGVEVVQSDRGGDVTFHGPGQVVAYPIVRLNDHRLSVGAFVRRLEETVIATLKEIRHRGAEVTRRDRRVGAGRWRDAREDLRARRAHPPRGEHARHRAERDDGPAVLRPDRAVRAAWIGAVTSVEKVLGCAAPTIEAVRER